MDLTGNLLLPSYVLFRSWVCDTLNILEKGFYDCFVINQKTYIYFSQKEIHIQLYVQMYLHAQSIFFIILILAMTTVGIKTTFTVTLTLVFYTLTMFINFFSKLHLKGLCSRYRRNIDIGILDVKSIIVIQLYKKRFVSCITQKS